MTVYVEKAIDLLDIQIGHVEQQIFAEQTGVNCPLKQKNKKLKWTVHHLDFVEWIYALNEILNLNGGTAKLKTLFEIFSPIFGMLPFNFSSYFTKIKNRQGDRTTLLDKQKKLLMERMEKEDETPSKK